MAPKVQLTMQGKGGVGKSFVAALLAEYYASGAQGGSVNVDTDPVNATFSRYPQFNVRRLELLRDGSIDTGVFDQLMTMIVSEMVNFVIDNGASCFVPLAQYMVESNPLDVLARMGREVAVHTVLTGGYGMMDTFAGLEWLAENLPEQAQIYVWLNEYFGKIEAQGKTFEQMKIYERYKDRITAVLRIPAQNPQTYGRDLQKMLDQRLTFAEAKVSPEFSIMSRERIAIMERQLFSQLAEVL